MDFSKAIYPIEPFCITEKEFLIENNYRNETTFALSNGYIGTRGTFEESYDFDEQTGLEGNFLNGFYESEDIRYGEWNFGFPQKSQSLLNLPNCKLIELFIGNERFSMCEGTLESYQRILHMDEAVLERTLIWTSESGKQLQLKVIRFVSLTHRNRMHISYEVTPLNFEGSITIRTGIDADVCNHTRTTNPLVDYGPFGKHLLPEKIMSDKDDLFYGGTTLNTKFQMACGCRHSLNVPYIERIHTEETEKAFIAYTVNCKKGSTVVMEKHIAYSSMQPLAQMEKFILEELTKSQKEGFKCLLKEQQDRMKELWQGADICIEGEDALVQGLRFNLFHILQAPGNDGKTGMGAKGLSGEGYEGHYFWDTEMYVLPVFIFTNPELAKQLLAFRYNTLPQARERARELGHEKGALYPWRTINGKEASTYFPLGTAQYHINADIAYAVALYWRTTKDTAFLSGMGAEILWETARVWADVGCFAESRNNQYCICSVTGPDEYNAIVDNNFYTNLMARENLYAALQAVEYLKEQMPEDYEKLAKKIELKEEEISLWKKVAENMYFPYDETKRIFPQDDGFMMRKPWDDSRIPPEKRHLLYENYHPLFIFRQRMAKQADAILGLLLCRHLYDKETLRRNYDFYQEVTLHHSSLSNCIFGMLASYIGYEEEAFDYFMQSARMDLDDYHHNFYAGIHAANMAGTWQALVFGFAGVNVATGILEIDPVLPKNWKRYSFSIRYHNRLLKITCDEEGVNVDLLEGEPIQIMLQKTELMLQKGGYNEEI